MTPKDTQLIASVREAIRLGRYAGASRTELTEVLLYAWRIQGDPIAPRLIAMAFDYNQNKGTLRDNEGFDGVCEALDDLYELVRQAREGRS